MSRKDEEYRKTKHKKAKDKYITEYQPINNNSNVNQIYYNIIVTNNNTSYDSSGNLIPTLPSIQLLFNQQRSIPYLNTPEDYNVIVPGFTLDSNSFPSQIVQPTLNGTYSTTTGANGLTKSGFPTIFTWSVHDIVNGYDFGPYQVLWQPVDNTLLLPSQPITIRQLTNQYFWNYSVDYFLDVLNNSILYELSNDPNYPVDISNCPYFRFDAATQLFSFNTNLTWRTDATGTNIDTYVPNIFGPPVIVSNYFFYVSTPLYNLFSGLPNIYNSNPNVGPYYQLLSVVNPNASNIFTQYNDLATYPSGGTNYIRTIQEYTSMPLWNPVSSIIFRSRELNVVASLEADPYIYGTDPTPERNSAGVSNNLFELFLGRRADPIINYYPSAEYKTINLLGIKEQSDLQIECLWKDYFGEYHPLFIEPGSTFDMKLLFRKKNFNK